MAYQGRGKGGRKRRKSEFLVRAIRPSKDQGGRGPPPEETTMLRQINQSIFYCMSVHIEVILDKNKNI